MLVAGVVVLVGCSSSSKRDGYGEELTAPGGVQEVDVVTFRVIGMMKTRSGAT